MRYGFFVAMLCIASFGMASLANAQDLGASSFAEQLNGSRGLYHDGTFNGPEVVYKSSTIATEQAAIATWQASPKHAALLNSGAITSIRCSGNACVGRGPAVESTTTVNKTRTVKRVRLFRR